MNSFVSTTKTRNLALFYLGDQEVPYRNMKRVLFEITADPKFAGEKPFADITTRSCFLNEEDEVLIMFGSIFRIINVDRETSGMSIVKIELCTNDNKDSTTILKHLKDEYGGGYGETDLICVGQVVRRMGCSSTAEKYFHRCLSSLGHEDVHLNTCYYNLAVVANDKGEYQSSLELHLKALNIRMRILQPNDPDLAESYNGLGNNQSKQKFSHWDLDRFSNITKIPRDKVEKLYQEFITSSGNDNRMDKKEFRRLYKEMYLSRQVGSEQGSPSAPAMWSEHDLEKMSDHVFKAFDREGSGKLSFEDFVNAYLLLENRPGASTSAVSSRDRFNYIMDHNNPTPGYVSREHGEQLLNRLNLCGTDDIEKPGQTTTWEHHWNKIDDGSGPVTQEKFVEYVTNSNDHKCSFKSSTA
ncbi:unnamed protein product [Rotaria sordida]|uniref:EF-hand domain-containing protein n=1 Tax=Rotaria sordida TaxID=392033 RepID=A0A815LZ05_9BILA|nr:unnamed protein product [Rotaria sordida]